MHELFEELEAFDPKWQQKYLRVIDAANAADLMDLYAAWIQTQEGYTYHKTMAGVAAYNAPLSEFRHEPTDGD